jgi:hypothetical protein
MSSNVDWNAGRRWRGTGWAVAAALMVASAGCGRSASDAALASTFYPVKGKVILPDGKAPPPIKLVFEGPVTADATTETDGTFAVKGTREGLPAGDYKVRLEVAVAKGSPKKPVLPFPAKYLDADSSGLTAPVKADGPNDFEFKLTAGEATPGKSGERPRSR